MYNWAQTGHLDLGLFIEQTQVDNIWGHAYQITTNHARSHET